MKQECYIVNIRSQVNIRKWFDNGRHESILFIMIGVILYMIVLEII
jgi:hypothetical protein